MHRFFLEIGCRNKHLLTRSVIYQCLTRTGAFEIDITIENGPLYVYIMVDHVCITALYLVHSGNLLICVMSDDVKNP